MKAKILLFILAILFVGCSAKEQSDNSFNTVVVLVKAPTETYAVSSTQVSNFNGKWIYNYVINPAIIKNSDTPPIRPYLPPFIKDYTND